MMALARVWLFCSIPYHPPFPVPSLNPAVCLCCRSMSHRGIPSPCPALPLPACRCFSRGFTCQRTPLRNVRGRLSESIVYSSHPLATWSIGEDKPQDGNPPFI